MNLGFKRFVLWRLSGRYRTLRPPGGCLPYGTRVPLMGPFHAMFRSSECFQAHQPGPAANQTLALVLARDQGCE